MERHGNQNRGLSIMYRFRSYFPPSSHCLSYGESSLSWFPLSFVFCVGFPVGGSDPTFVMQYLLFSYYYICNPASDMCSLLFSSINVLCQLSIKPNFFLLYSKRYRYCIQTEQKTKHRTFYYIIIQCFKAFGSVNIKTVFCVNKNYLCD